SQILDLDDKSLDSLTEEQLDALDKIDDLLAKFDRNPEKKYQILREVSPDLSKSALHSAESNTRNLLNVVGLRFSAPAAVQRRGYNGGYYNRYYGYYGRSGGDYTVGEGSVWAQGMINRVKSTAEQPFSATSGGFAAGIEVNASEAFKFGFGYAYTDTNIKSDRSKNNAETHSGFVYGHLQPQRAYFNFIAAFAHSKYKDTTSLARLESDYDTNSVSAQIAFGYTALLTPEIGLRYTNIHQSAFEDALGAKSQAKNVNAVTGTSGLKLSRRYRLRANPQVAFVPELKAAAAYDFERSNNDIAVLLPNGATYTVDGEKTKRFGVETGAGLTVYFGKDAVASLSYDGKFKKDYQDHTGMVNLKIKF
ncbi:MAG: autotransporter outer membrane beta-barrel domain-containing protein, partial [Acetobacter sp.]|nr:autotransporter outer membrane beta-barrel domain-containing protein [Acetobacter sp.]